MSLLTKYQQLTESAYCKFYIEKNIDVTTKIFLFKLNNDALVEANVNGDPVIDQPGCRLYDFIENELVK